MKLVRSAAIALVAAAVAICGAAAQDPTTPPPTTAPVPTTPAPTSTTVAPTPTAPAPTTKAPGTPAIPTTTPAPDATSVAPIATADPPSASESVQGQALIVQLSENCSTARLQFLNNIMVLCDGCADFSTVAANTQVHILTSAATKKLTVYPLSSDKLTHVEIDSNTKATPTLELRSTAFSRLESLSSLAFTNVEFLSSLLPLGVPNSLAYLKLKQTNVRNIALNVHYEERESSLNKIEFTGNQFTELPLIFYQRNYTKTLEVNQDFTFTGPTSALSAEEFANAQFNLGDGLAKVLVFQSDCGSSAATAETRHVVCLDATKSGIRSLTSAGGSGSSSSSSEGSPAPSPSPRGSSSADTTLTIVVIVIAVIAAILAYFVSRRYFCKSSDANTASPHQNDRAVGLISKEESHAVAGGGKLSFISSDDTLRQIRLEQQDVSLNKSVGTGFLWTGDYHGKKVIIKRVEAESNDPRVTKALISQARSLAPLSHPNLAKLIGVTWIQGTDFGIVAEFMEKGTLKSVLMDMDNELDLQSKLHMCLDIAQALVYLHNSDHNMYMKGLSSRKVLVNGAIECKLNLFECHHVTSKIDVPDVFGAGEMAWWAPELVLHKGVLDARKVNVFALGVLICEIITRASPYQSVVDEKGHTLADLELSHKIRRQERLTPHENRREFTDLPAALRDVVERCLSYQPHMRPTAEEVVQCLESVKDYSERMGSTTSL